MSHSTINRNAEKFRPHWIEWLTGLVSTLIIVAVTGWIVWEALSADERAPELSARITNIEPVASGWRVMIEVSNISDVTAAAVAVKGELSDGNTTIEEVEVTFDYIAAGSSTRGGFLFTNDPSRYRLIVKPSGFTEP